MLLHRFLEDQVDSLLNARKSRASSILPCLAVRALHPMSHLMSQRLQTQRLSHEAFHLEMATSINASNVWRCHLPSMGSRDAALRIRFVCVASFAAPLLLCNSPLLVGGWPCSVNSMFSLSWIDFDLRVGEISTLLLLL